MGGTVLAILADEQLPEKAAVLGLAIKDSLEGLRVHSEPGQRSLEGRPATFLVFSSLPIATPKAQVLQPPLDAKPAKWLTFRLALTAPGRLDHVVTSQGGGLLFAKFPRVGSRFQKRGSRRRRGKQVKKHGCSTGANGITSHWPP